METNFKNNLAPAVIELNRMNEELQAENERLKYALKQRTAQSDANANLWMKELRRGARQEKEIEHLRKENAKLKCLALHLFKVVGYNESKNWGRIRDGFDQESKLKQRCSRHSDRWRRIANKCHEAYTKAKAELKEG